MNAAFNPWLLIAVGAAAGAFLRFTIGRAASFAFPSDWPYGTLTVNLTGCFMLGMLSASAVPAGAKLAFGTGFLGAYTTFSTLHIEALMLARQGKKKKALLYVLTTYAMCIALAWAGASITG